MGCKSSKLNDSEVSWRCRKRKRIMSDALKYRQEFAAAHLAYVKILGTVGHALTQYGDRQLSNLQVVPAGSTVQNSEPAAKPAASKPPQQIYLKPPPSSSSKLPAEPPASVAPPPSQPGPSSLNSDAKTIENVPISEENSEPIISNGSFSPNLESLEQEFPGDVLIPSAPSSPIIGGSSSYVWSQPSSPLNSGWDPFNLFAAVPTHSTDPTSRYAQNWDAVFQTYDDVDLDGLPELEEDDDNGKGEVYEASQSSAVPSPPEKAKAIESSTKPEKKTAEANSGKVLETIDEESAEMGEGSSEGATLENQEKGATQKVKDPAGITVDGVKHISECVVRIKDDFARASKSGDEVLDMLGRDSVHPLTRTLSLTDSFGLSRSMSWRLSRKSLSSEISFKESDNDELKHESLALTLEKLYTWEKKLYKEVKVGEHLHIALSRKRKEFRSADSRGKDPDLVEEFRADVKSLESQLDVAFRATRKVSLRIQKLTTEELYPQLIELLRRLKAMWKVMLECHTAQKAAAQEILNIEKSGQKFAASDAHRSAAMDLEAQLDTWQQCFNVWVAAQQRYIDALDIWIRVCHMGPELNDKKRDATPPALPAAGKAPIYALARNWHDSLLHLEKNNEVVGAINRFVGLVHLAQVSESEELAEMKRAEMLSRSIDRRSRKGFPGQERAIIQDDTNAIKEMQREDMVLLSLQQHLPAIFEALTTFSSLACTEYEKLYGGADTSTKE